MIGSDSGSLRFRLIALMPIYVYLICGYNLFNFLVMRPQIDGQISSFLIPLCFVLSYIINEKSIFRQNFNLRQITSPTPLPKY